MTPPVRPQTAALLSLVLLASTMYVLRGVPCLHTSRAALLEEVFAFACSTLDAGVWTTFNRSLIESSASIPSPISEVILVGAVHCVGIVLCIGGENSSHHDKRFLWFALDGLSVSLRSLLPT